MSVPKRPVYISTHEKGFREARVSCKWMIHRYLTRISPEALRLYLFALLWAVNNQTDGIINDEVFEDCLRLGREGIAELEECGLWVVRGDGWLIPEFAITQVTSRRVATRHARQERTEVRRATAELVDAFDDRIDEGETFLYRWYDIDDRLLYIGITNDLDARRAYHKALSSWADFAVTEKVESYPRREIALGVEAAVIIAEQPLFNHVHQDTPEARERLVRYLVEKERFDLLAPAVTRGAVRDRKKAGASHDRKSKPDWPGSPSIPGQRPDLESESPRFPGIDRVARENATGAEP